MDFISRIFLKCSPLGNTARQLPQEGISLPTLWLEDCLQFELSSSAAKEHSQFFFPSKIPTVWISSLHILLIVVQTQPVILSAYVLSLLYNLTVCNRFQSRAHGQKEITENSLGIASDYSLGLCSDKITQVFSSPVSSFVEQNHYNLLL